VQHDLLFGCDDRACIFVASFQASDVGSIPIARSKTYRDSVAFTPPDHEKPYKITDFGPQSDPNEVN